MAQKPDVVKVGECSVRRIRVKTGLLTETDRIEAVVEQVVKPAVQPGDIITIAESPVAIMQSSIVFGATIRYAWDWRSGRIARTTLYP